MKTIRETINKWNEMYEFAKASSPAADNKVWMKSIGDLLVQSSQYDYACV